MKITLVIIASLIPIAFLGLFILGFMSQSGEAKGLVSARLAKCPDKPNCICTEFEADATHYVDPIDFSQTTASEALTRMRNSIREAGGIIQAENDNYLSATFSSSFFKFVDDLEVRIDMNQEMIHMRSASRVGHSDRGINKSRIEHIKSLYQMKAE